MCIMCLDFVNTVLHGRTYHDSELSAGETRRSADCYHGIKTKYEQRKWLAAYTPSVIDLYELVTTLQRTG